MWCIGRWEKWLWVGAIGCGFCSGHLAFWNRGIFSFVSLNFIVIAIIAMELRILDLGLTNRFLCPRELEIDGCKLREVKFL